MKAHGDVSVLGLGLCVLGMREEINCERFFLAFAMPDANDTLERSSSILLLPIGMEYIPRGGGVRVGLKIIIESV